MRTIKLNGRPGTYKLAEFDLKEFKEWNATKAPYRLQGLKFLRTLWLCAIAGGPFQYTAKTLGDAHFDFEFTSQEFDAVAAVLAGSLDHFHIPQQEKEEVLGAFAAFKPVSSV